jgi:hypothetical protein
MSMLIRFTILMIALSSYVKCMRPAHPKCKDIITNATILNTLNGQIKGACYNITVKYSNKNKNYDSPLLVWLSVPYAKSPTGYLRFKSPQPTKSWSNVLNGLDYPYKCVQAHGSDQKYSREDCLYLNIYVPYKSYVDSMLQNNTNGSLLPIYVLIHGGHIQIL